MKFLDKLRNIDALIAFLALECLAITSFALGGLTVVFYVVGILISIFCAFVAYNRFSKNEAKSLILFMGVMVLLSIFVSFGNLLREAYGAENVVLLLALNAFLLIGIASRRINGFQPETFLLTIGVSLALLTFISMIYSWTQYGLFYASMYKDTPIYYYNAQLFDVTKEGFWLHGFSFKETSIAYTGIFGLLESCFLIGTLYANPKTEKVKFSLYLSVGLIGMIYLVTIPNVVALLFFIPVLIIATIYRFLRDKKYTGKVITYSLLGFGGLAFLFFIFALINAKGGNGFSSFVEGNKVLNRVFNANGLMARINPTLHGITQSTDQLFLGLRNVYENEEIVITNSRMFEIELLKEGGLLAFLCLLAFIVVSIFVVGKYLKKSKDYEATNLI